MARNKKATKRVRNNTSKVNPMRSFLRGVKRTQRTLTRVAKLCTLALEHLDVTAFETIAKESKKSLRPARKAAKLRTRIANLEAELAKLG